MHRRTSSLAVVGAVAAVGASLAAVGAEATDAQSMSEGTQRAVRIQPGELRRGPDATVLHSTGSTIHVGDRDIHTDLSGQLYVVGRADGGFVVATTSTNRLWNVHGDGSATSLGRIRGYWENIEVSTDGSRVAYSWRQHGHVKVTIRRTTTGDRLHTPRFADDVELVGYGKRRLLLSKWSPDRTFWHAPASGDRKVLARRVASSVDIARDRVGFAVRDPNGYDGLCVGYSRLSHPHRTTWYSCKQRPVAWSSTLGRVLTVDIRTDGLGPGTVQLRKVDGTLLRTFRSGLFGDVRFAGPHTVMLNTQGAHSAALVRCTLEGGHAHCTRSTRLWPAHEFGPNNALRLSMPS